MLGLVSFVLLDVSPVTLRFFSPYHPNRQAFYHQVPFPYLPLLRPYKHQNSDGSFYKRLKFATGTGTRAFSRASLATDLTSGFPDPGA